MPKADILSNLWLLTLRALQIALRGNANGPGLFVWSSTEQRYMRTGFAISRFLFMLPLRQAEDCAPGSVTWQPR